MQFFEDTLYYSYLEVPTGAKGQGQITFAHTVNQGDTWTQVRATYGNGLYADKETFSIGKDGTIYLVYSDYYSDENESYTWLKLSRSYDGGNTFVENTTINDRKGIDISAYCYPNDLGKILVVWTHYSWNLEIDAAPNPSKSSLLLDISTDYGNTFGKDQDFIPEYNATWSYRNPQNNRSAKHTIAALEMSPINERIYAVWADVSTDVNNPINSWDVYMRYSDDFGISWGSIIRVNKILAGNQWNPDLEFDAEGNLHFIYFDESVVDTRHLKHRIYYPELNLFSDEMQVTTEASSPAFTRPGEYMSIRLDSNGFPNIVWTDTRNDELDIYFAKGQSSSISDSTTSFESSSSTSDSKTSGFLISSLVLLLIPVKLKKTIKWTI
jgi:hypothetical protein